MESNFAATMELVPETSWACVKLTGDVDLAVHGRLDDIVRVLSAAETRDVHIDLAGVTFADSSLVNFLVSAGATETLGGPLVLCRVPHQVAQLIDVVGLHTTVLLRDDEHAHPPRPVLAPPRTMGTRFTTAGESAA